MKGVKTKESVMGYGTIRTVNDQEMDELRAIFDKMGLL